MWDGALLGRPTSPAGDGASRYVVLRNAPSLSLSRRKRAGHHAVPPSTLWDPPLKPVPCVAVTQHPGPGGRAHTSPFTARCDS